MVLQKSETTALFIRTVFIVIIFFFFNVTVLTLNFKYQETGSFLVLCLDHVLILGVFVQIVSIFFAFLACHFFVFAVHFFVMELVVVAKVITLFTSENQL